MGRGRLRIYLGAAPGVGKTYAMLGEGHRRNERGTDVVVAFVEDHGRSLTRAMADGLEIMPRRQVAYRGRHVPGDGHRRGARPAPQGGAGRRARPYKRPRVPEREALAGRARAARRRDRRDLHGERPAPGVPQRRRRDDHRRTAARDRPRLGGPRRRPGRARGHVAGGAAAPDGARQRVPARTHRRRTVAVLPGRQPHRAARARPALARRQGRGGPAEVPGRARHHRPVGDPRAGRRRTDRRPGGGDAAAPRRPGSRRGRSAASSSPCTSPARTG